MDSSIFEQIASSLTVKAIYEPTCPDVQSEATFADVEELLLDPSSDPYSVPYRVVDSEGKLAGMLWFENWYSDEGGHQFVHEVMERIEPDEFLSASTTILEAVELFGAKDNAYFYVLHVNEVVGVLRYSDLFKPLGRLAFLALALEIEDQALRLCQSASLRERCWHSISDNRRGKAIELFNQRSKRRREPSQKLLSSDILQLIQFTQLGDKATMIWKQKLIPSASRGDVLGFFKKLKSLRDQCAHPGGDEDLLPKATLAHFVNSALNMRTTLRAAMEAHGVSTEPRRAAITLD
jgi:hypothetical protein